MKRFWRKYQRKPDVCFISLDITPETLSDCAPSEIEALVDLFHNILPLNDDEHSLLYDSKKYNSIELFRSFCLWCIRRRKGYIPLSILPTEMVIESPLQKFLHTEQHWMCGFKFTHDRLTDIYSYLLKSISQMVQLPNRIPQAKDKWQTITITLGPIPIYQYEPNEPMNIATKLAADQGVIIIVAAGNEGQHIKGNSLNPWSVSPWVIGVGATSEDGTRLMDISSKGSPEQSHESPTIVAPGEAISPLGGLGHGIQMALQEIEKAPPRSATTAVVGNHVYNFVKDKNGRIGISHIQDGIASPIAPLEQALQYLKQENAARLSTLRGTSLSAEYVSGVCQQIIKSIKPRIPNLLKSTRPKLIKTILEDMAHPFSDLPLWEIGKGLITTEIAISYLDSLTDNKLKQLQCKAINRW